MDLFNNLILGFSVALHWNNILYCLVGCLLGTLIGVLPGIGPIATIAMLLPATFVLTPVAALIMLAGLESGAPDGGLTPARTGDPAEAGSRAGDRRTGRRDAVDLQRWGARVRPCY